ncbi:MAG: GNAT family N-acetyltransferase [Phycisphaerae bacterium]
MAHAAPPPFLIPSDAATLAVMPRLFDMQVRTPRLQIAHEPAPVVADHVEAVNASLASLRPYLYWSRPEQTREHIEKNLKDLLRWHVAGQHAIYIMRLHDGRFAGMLGFHHFNALVPAAEVGYWMRDDLTGQGLMTEALQAVSDYALQVAGVHRLQLVAARPNAASRRVARKCGFEEEGVRRQSFRLLDGSLADEFVYVRFGAGV